MSASDRPFRFTTLEFPGAASTIAFGIGAGGEIVGSFVEVINQATVTHGFVLDGGEYSTVNYPGASYTDVRGIGTNGAIVGTYRMPGEPVTNAHGYVRSADGEFTAIDYVGHTNTIVQRVFSDGSMIGSYFDGGFATSHGVIWEAGSETPSDQAASMHNAATPDLRMIVGEYVDAPTNQLRGYLITDGDFTAVMVPGSSQTEAWDINPRGDVVGFYRDAGGFHGFVLTAAGFSAVNVPGATATRVYGVSPSGDIVGNFVSGGRTRAFVATRTDVSVSPVPTETPCPASVLAVTSTATCYTGIGTTHAPYLIVIPANWDHNTLLLWAHGTTTAPQAVIGLGPLLPLLRDGYAFAASDFRGPTPMAKEAAEDTELLRQTFQRFFGETRRTVVHGLSYGGLVTARCAELFGVAPNGERRYSGALVGCGLVAGTLRTYYTRMDTRLVYQYFCNNLPRSDERPYDLYLGLDPQLLMTLEEVNARMNACTGVNLQPAQRTAQQSQNLANITRVLRIPEKALPAMMQAGTVYIKSIVADRLNGRNPFPNIGVMYTGSTDDAALNAGIARYASDPRTVAMVADADDPTGDAHIPVVTIHAINDPRAFIEQENFYRQKFEAAQTTDYLLQMPTNDGDHCLFTTPEWVGAMRSLLKWIDTDLKPTKAEVAASCDAARAQFPGACRFNLTFEPAPLETRMYARQP